MAAVLAVFCILAAALRCMHTPTKHRHSTAGRTRIFALLHAIAAAAPELLASAACVNVVYITTPWGKDSRGSAVECGGGIVLVYAVRA